LPAENKQLSGERFVIYPSVDVNKQEFLALVLGSQLGIILILVLFGSFSVELVVVLSTVLFLFITVVTAPTAATPAWRKRLRVFLALAIVTFLVVVVRRMVSALA